MLFPFLGDYSVLITVLLGILAVSTFTVIKLGLGGSTYNSDVYASLKF
jgi:hypothetical protein